MDRAGPSVFSDVKASFKTYTSPPRMPPVLEGLELLGVSNLAAAAQIGISPCIFSLWRTGAKPIPRKHRPGLKKVLAVACRAARVRLGSLATLNDAFGQAHYEALRQRLIRAEAILAAEEVTS